MQDLNRNAKLGIRWRGPLLLYHLEPQLPIGKNLNATKWPERLPDGRLEFIVRQQHESLQLYRAKLAAMRASPIGQGGSQGRRTVRQPE
jgi:hypothetical protein